MCDDHSISTMCKRYNHYIKSHLIRNKYSRGFTLLARFFVSFGVYDLDLRGSMLGEHIIN